MLTNPLEVRSATVAIPLPPDGRADALPATLATRTRRVYDRLAPIYALSTILFHSRAHRQLLDCCGIRDGMSVLEVATGSGEMFRRLVRVNRNGSTFGVDLSPNMAARSQRLARRRWPGALARCQAVDARQMPFRESTFDVVVCCYLLELLSGDDIARAVAEFRRILRPQGKLALVMIGEEVEAFNRIYRIAGRIAPAFWGRQVERRVPELIEATDFRILTNQVVRQGFYPSRVLVARK